MDLKKKFIVFFIILSIVSFVYFSDKVREPIIIKAPNNSTTLGCDEASGFILRNDSANQSHKQCWKEAGFGHTKYSVLQALAMALWTGAGLIFFLEYKRKDESPVVQFAIDKYQNPNRPIPRCPDIHTSDGFTWTNQGFSAIISSTEPVVFVSTNDLVKRVSISLLFWGAREKISPLELYYYLGENAILFKKITGADASNIVSPKRVRKEDAMPEIFIARSRPYEEMKSYYSIRGGYAVGVDRFDTGIGTLFQIKKSIEFLSKKMDETLVGMMYYGEKFVACVRRTSNEADEARRADATEAARMQPSPYNHDQTREI